MWSSVTIPGSLRILIVDATQNIQGWEHTFSDRLYQSFKKTGLQMPGDTPLHIKNSAELNRLGDFEFNCLLLLAHSQSDLLEMLSQQQLSPYLLALCATESFDPQASDLILKSVPAITPLAVAPMSRMSPREAGLFYLKFFTELKLHSTNNISGKMVWFSFSKAKELLKRRRYAGKFGVRC